MLDWFLGYVSLFVQENYIFKILIILYLDKISQNKRGELSVNATLQGVCETIATVENQ